MEKDPCRCRGKPDYMCHFFHVWWGFSSSGRNSSAEPEILEGTEVELIKVTKPEFITVIEPEFLEVTEPEFMELTDPDILEPFVSSDGLTKRGGQQKSVEQIMCGTSNGLPTPRKCLFEGR
ncbi:MAG: hypothetical protein IH886_13615 [Nitrospinae bacterium]|nr:hypothetical protein [Nitrospinota bacterium]